MCAGALGELLADRRSGGEGVGGWPEQRPSWQYLLSMTAIPLSLLSLLLVLLAHALLPALRTQPGLNVMGTCAALPGGAAAGLAPRPSIRGRSLRRSGRPGALLLAERVLLDLRLLRAHARGLHVGHDDQAGTTPPRRPWGVCRGRSHGAERGGHGAATTSRCGWGCGGVVELRFWRAVDGLRSLVLLYLDTRMLVGTGSPPPALAPPSAQPPALRAHRPPHPGGG